MLRKNLFTSPYTAQSFIKRIKESIRRQLAQELVSDSRHSSDKVLEKTNTPPQTKKQTKNNPPPKKKKTMKEKSKTLH